VREGEETTQERERSERGRGNDVGERASRGRGRDVERERRERVREGKKKTRGGESVRE